MTKRGPSSYDQPVLDALSQLISDHGLTYRAMEERLGEHRGFIADLMRGHRVLRYTQIVRILRELGVSEANFFAQLYSGASTAGTGEPGGVTREQVKAAVREVLAERGIDGATGKVLDPPGEGESTAKS